MLDPNEKNIGQVVAHTFLLQYLPRHFFSFYLFIKETLVIKFLFYTDFTILHGTFSFIFFIVHVSNTYIIRVSVINCDILSKEVIKSLQYERN